ncbi:dCTP deaminase [Vulcanisaeta souniana]|uniref:Deoxycytidine triphosphate deaminase n=1 Tax=Vulcanisaeta souniana JCM 11219 TaxID=1293586 RepID=A0A830E4H4_9CREN|nr:dCTP deaminase [Vulcanisaeta souniana]BDR91179.1 deoxycytidine triphosphate deaminase [Vulcanisaeta souniana JCM 11219]GGI81508.1 deoxycytidine triphosphate deaminase [Vulcanisaeta souniana JCM 11219]
MAVLARNELLKLIKDGVLSIEPFSEDVVRENGLDLRVGTEYAIYAFDGQVIDPCELESTRHLFSIVEAKDGRIVIPPRSFALLTTMEYVKFPKDVVGFCNLRSTLARYGLSVPPTIIDAGFEGNVTIEVINNSGNYMVLRPRMRFLHVVPVRAIGEAKYLGKYLGQRGVTPPKGMKGEC